MKILRAIAVLFLLVGTISLTVEIVLTAVIGPQADEPPVLHREDGRPSAPRIAWKSASAEPTKAVVEVAGLDPAILRSLEKHEMPARQWMSFLSVRVIRASLSRSEADTPLWGSYQVKPTVLQFTPRFTLEPGMSYRAELDLVALDALITSLEETRSQATRPTREASRLVADYTLAKPDTRATSEVAAVYPTSPVLPENLLRFYIVFTAPMSQREAYQRIQLLDAATGHPVEGAFLELDEELWSPDGTRFTLYLDPGRVKRGLKPREELGPVLQAGRSYFLIVDADWPDARGNALKAGFRKSFRVVAPDDISPAPKTWKIEPPRANTREPLEIRFPEPLDHALADRLISVHDAASRIVPGHSTLAEAETVWRLTPASPWSAGDYRLVVDSALEDVAGNSVARPFEVDVTTPISQRVSTKTVELSFKVAAAAAR